VVILSTSFWKSSILKLSPTTVVLIWDKDLIVPWGQVTGALSDYDLTGPLYLAWEHVSHFVVLPRACRKKTSGWNHQKLYLRHWEFGGVTDGAWNCHLYTSSYLPHEFSLLREAGCDASTLLDQMTVSGRPCKPPLPIEKGSQPSVHLVREQCYHGLGLLPWNTAQPWVVTPHVFSPSKWCCKKVTVQEHLYSRDLSKSCVSQLSSAQQGHLSGDTNYIPEKCWKNHSLPQRDLNLGTNYSISSLTLGVIQTHQGKPEPTTVEERLEKERAFKRIQAATKADDAEVPVELWDSRVLPGMDPENGL
jgi:hypothetical protein